MEKSVIITIMVDDVKITDLENLLEKVDQLLALYENKRVSVNLQDERLVSRG